MYVSEWFGMSVPNNIYFISHISLGSGFWWKNCHWFRIRNIPQHLFGTWSVYQFEFDLYWFKVVSKFLSIASWHWPVANWSSSSLVSSILIWYSESWNKCVQYVNNSLTCRYSQICSIHWGLRTWRSHLAAVEPLAVPTHRLLSLLVLKFME